MLELLRRFVPPYRKEMALNIVFNLLSTVLSLFSFATIIPIQQLLFGINERVACYVEWDMRQSAGEILYALKNNIFYLLQIQTDSRGAGYVLFLLGVFLVVMTFLKVAAYLASFYMIPIRTGVLRDLRKLTPKARNSCRRLWRT